MNDKALTFEYMRRVVENPELAEEKNGRIPPHLRPDGPRRSEVKKKPVQTDLPLPKP